MQLGMYEAVPEAGQVPPRHMLIREMVVMSVSAREHRMIF